MSRSIRGAKRPGFEFWSKRPGNGFSGPDGKDITHGLERAAAKEDLLKQQQNGEFVDGWYPDFDDYDEPDDFEKENPNV